MERKPGKIIIDNIPEYLEDLKRGKKFYQWAEKKLAASIISEFIQEGKKEIRLLDAGCGIAMFPEQLFYWAQKAGIELKITIIDNLSSVLPLAKRALEKKGIKDVVCVAGDATKMPLPDNSFDLVTAMLFLYYLDEQEKVNFFNETYRVLAPGGKFYFCSPNRNRLVWLLTYTYQLFLYQFQGGKGRKFELEAIEYSHTSPELYKMINQSDLGKNGLNVKTIWGGLWVKAQGGVNKFQ